MKKLAALFLALTLLGAAAGCQSSTPNNTDPAPATNNATDPKPAEPAKKLKIGFTAFSLDDKFVTYLLDGAQKFADEHKDEMELVVTDAKADVNLQTNQMENFVSQQFDAAVIQIVDPSIGPSLVKIANDANMPLVGCNRVFDGIENATSFIGSESKQAGVEQAKWVAEKLGGKGSVVIIQGTLGTEAQIYRCQGYEEVLKDYPDIKVVAENTGKWDRAEGMRLMENWLQMDMQIDAVLSNNDEMAIGASNALVAANKKDQVLVTGVDATPDALELMKEGKLDATVYQPAGGQGYNSVKAAFEAAKGQPVEKEIWIKFELVTPDKADEYLAKY